MKRFFRAACAGLALTAALTLPAFAADFTECADQLKELGLFQGTQAGYELDRAPTRAEAAAMLVRLLGQEQAAQALTYDAPFTDLQGWEKPYVQYLYENGLTTGATATTFAPRGTCTAQMYGAFLLRALGYSEADGDFAYADAVSFAAQRGVYDETTVDPARFLRDHVAAASYAALAASPKDSDKTLLKTLVDAGAVDQEASSRLLTMFSTYQSYRSATAGMDGLTALSVSNELTASVSSSWEARETDKLFALTSTETSKLDLTAPALLTQRTVAMRAPGQTEKTFLAESYTADGFRYLTQNGRKSRMAQTDAQMRQLAAGYARVPVALVDDITRSPSGSYTIGYNKAGLSRLSEALSAAADAVGDLREMTLHTLSVKQDVSAGRIVSQDTTVEFDGGDVAGTLKSVMKLLAVNDEVALTPPVNLAQYPLVQ